MPGISELGVCGRIGRCRGRLQVYLRDAARSFADTHDRLCGVILIRSKKLDDEFKSHLASAFTAPLERWPGYRIPVGLKIGDGETGSRRYEISEVENSVTAEEI